MIAEASAAVRSKVMFPFLFIVAPKCVRACVRVCVRSLICYVILFDLSRFAII